MLSAFIKHVNLYAHITAGTSLNKTVRNQQKLVLLNVDAIECLNMFKHPKFIDFLAGFKAL